MEPLVAVLQALQGKYNPVILHVALTYLSSPFLEPLAVAFLTKKLGLSETDAVDLYRASECLHFDPLAGAEPSPPAPATPVA